MTEEVIQEVPSEEPTLVDNPAEPTPAIVEEKHKPDNVQRRIDKLTRDKYQARAELDVLRREVEALRNQSQPRQEARRDDGMPRLDQFDNFEDYITAKAEYIADQRMESKLSAREQRLAEERSKQTAQSASETWQKRVAELRKTVPDFDDVIESADIQITKPVGDALMESEMGPQVALYLARNPEEADRLSSLSPSAVSRAIGRIEAKLETEALTDKQKSSAPKPASPVGGRAGSDTGPNDNQSTEDWIKARNKQLAAARKIR